MKLAALMTHPVQYYAPLFRELSRQCPLIVYYEHLPDPEEQGIGFGNSFSWDVDLLSGYDYSVLSELTGSSRVFSDSRVCRIFEKDGVDVLLVMGWYTRALRQGARVARKLGIPVIARGDSHLDTPRSLIKVIFKRMFFPSFLRRFDAALVVGERNRAYWEHYGYPQTRMFDVPHCVDNAFFAERATPAARAALRARLGIALDARVVLFAGKLVAFKRPLDVIEAVAGVRRNGVSAEVLVAGEGVLVPELRQLARDLNVPLHMLGFQNQTEMPAAYAASDVLVLPSDGRETWGLVVNEALASGTPALVSDAVGCAPDVLELLGPGSVFRLGDVAHLTERLQTIFLTPHSVKSIRCVASAFDLSIVADQIASAGESLLKRRNGAADF